METSSYLQTTQNVVSAMSARMTGYCPALDSDNESDEDTSQSLRQNISKGPRYPSDTESSDERHPMAQSPISNTKYNRELGYASALHNLRMLLYIYICTFNYCFSLRRMKLDPQRVKPLSSIASRAKNSSQDLRGKSETSSIISRTDSGRPSARVSRASSMVGPTAYYILV